MVCWHSKFSSFRKGSSTFCLQTNTARFSGKVSHTHKGYLFKLRPDHILRRCIREDEVHYILHACHDEPCGGHFAAKRTTHKVIQAGYYWPTLHRGTEEYVSHCDECQRMGKPTKRDEMPLQLQVSLEPFSKWGLDFVGSIDPPSNKKEHILVCTDYFTKWSEVKSMKNAKE